MAWNEPGNSGGNDNDKDPWGRRKNEQGPPDLDEIMKKISGKLGGIFGGKGGGGQGSGSAGGYGGIILVLIVITVVWLAYDSFYRIDQSERGVVTRFGKYVATLQPGLSMRLPRPFEYVEKVNVTQIRHHPLNVQLLTKDLNLIRISLVVRYKVQNEIDYAFNVRNPNVSLHETTESALREVVGDKTMDEMLGRSSSGTEPSILDVVGDNSPNANKIKRKLDTPKPAVTQTPADELLGKGSGRQVLVSETKDTLQKTLNKYKTGLEVLKVNLENIQPPEKVQDAFQDAIKAEEDEEKLKKQAEAYALDIIPKAEGAAERMLQEAEAYKERVVKLAEGEASRFTQTLREYKKAPEITRKRLYLETMEQLLANSSKVMVKIDKGSNLMYLPIDKFMGRDTRTNARGGAGDTDLNNRFTESLGDVIPAPGDSSRSRERDRRIR